MNESIEKAKEQWQFPDIDAERGEFERVASEFSVDADTLIFLAQEEGKLVQLEEPLWSHLTNTDSDRVTAGDWKMVEEIYSGEEYQRDWQGYKKRMEQEGGVFDAPIIAKIGDVYHLVSGNTRLIVARALGIVPRVLLFEYRHEWQS
jgi:hypothetical protein